MERRPISDNEAVRLWNEVKGSLVFVIVKAIRTMKLPVPATCSIPASGTLPRPRTPSPGEVRLVLLRDSQFHEDLSQRVAEEFWSGVRRGVVPAGASPGWLIITARRVTWRRATKRAKELFATTIPISQSSDAHFDLGSPILDMEDVIDLRRHWSRLEPLLRELSDIDRRSLYAMIHVDSTYKELAAELGLTNVAVRQRARRARSKLSEKLLQ